MFGKLLKYEMKAISRTMLPIYLLTLVSSVFAGASIGYSSNNASSFLPATGLTAYTILVGLTFGVCLFVNILRFRDDLFGKKAYSTLTLPVSLPSHIFAKLLASTIWMFFSSVIFIASIIILTIAAGKFNPAFIIENPQQYIDQITRLNSKDLALAAAIILTSFISSMMHIYASIAVGYQFHQHPLLASIIAYIVTGVISIAFINFSSDNLAIFMLVSRSIEAVIFFGICYGIMRFHMNLE